MSEQPKVNQVKLSGIIKSHSVKESSGFGLVDPQTDGSRFIAVSIHESKELVDKWKTFNEGDYVQIVGFIRSWSKKLENGWQNNTEVRITHIVNTGSGKKKAGPPASDDALPF